MILVLRDSTVFVGTGSSAAEPGRPYITFIHGAGFDHSVWVMPARHFARHGYNVIAVDLPGHGRSGGTPLTSIEAMANWLHELVDTLGVSSTVVVGHSMGSLIGYEFASRWPEQTQALALLGTSLPMRVGAPLLDAAADDDPAAYAMANTWSHSAQGQLGANSNPGVWMLGAGTRWLDHNDAGVYHADLTACNAYEPKVGPEQLTCPALVLVGGADQMTPARAGAAVAAGIKGAKHIVLDGCGHSMLSERPNAVLDALRELVSQTST